MPNNHKNSRTPDHPPLRAPRVYRLAWLFVVQLLLSILLPLLFFLIQHKQIETDQLQLLTSRVSQKATQIDSWIDERLGDAEILQHNPLFIGAAQQFNHDEKYQGHEIIRAFTQFQQSYNYESLEFRDATGRPRLVLGNPPFKISGTEPETDGKQAIRIDWFLDQNQALYMGLSIPLRDPNSFYIIGNLYLTQDVRISLLPNINVWPVQVKTGLSRMLKRTHDQLLVISIPANEPQKTRIESMPLDSNSPLLTQALGDEAGQFVGKDWHDQAVYASYRPVGLTGWHLLVQEDQDELLTHLYRQTGAAALLLFILGSIINSLVYRQWRRQNQQYEVELQQQTAEKDHLLRHFFELPLFGMAITHSRTGRWIRFNDQFCDLLGYSKTDMLQQTLFSLFVDKHADLEAIEKGEDNGFQCECQLRRQDGSLLDANVDTRYVRDTAGRVSFIITVIEDISARKQSERELRKRTNLYNMLSHSNQAIVHSHSRAELIKRVCESAVQDGEFSLAMVGHYLPEIDDLEIVYTAGDNAGFCEWITEHKRQHPELIPHTGAMQAIHLNRSLVLNRYLETELTTPFHAIAEQAQVRAAAYYPIREQGELYGVLALYSSELDFFSESTQRTLEEITHDLNFGLDNLLRDQQLMASERLFHNLTSFVQVGIFRLDLKGRLVYMNEFGLSLLQRANNTHPEHLLQAVAPEYQQRIREQWMPHLLAQGEAEMECLVHDSQLHEIWLVLHARAETDASGNIIGYIGTLTDISRIKQSEQQLKQLAYYDPLTGPPNRSLFSLNLAQSISTAQQHAWCAALLLIDLDHFKDVNDTFGHPIGDLLLKDVATRMRSQLPVTAQLCRIGGDEFTVLLTHDPTRAEIDAVASNLIQVMKPPFRLPNGRDVIVGASIGISLAPDHGQDPFELMQKADSAMYHAKANGRNAYCYFTSELGHLAERRMDTEVRLKHALEHQQLRAYYQPQVDIRTGRIIGAEALIRWLDPERGLIPPSEFISIAEETGLIKPIGEWMLQETCRQGQEWLAKGLPSLTLAVNISPVQFRYQDLLSVINQTLAQTGFPAESLEVEITESTLMSREQEATERMNQLRETGIRVAIDDFGTGYSSLSYLTRFPLDILKIDKSFVDQIPQNTDDMEIAATIIAMAHTLRLKVLAEGVETQQQLDFLQRQGCDMYQGYLMSQPLPAAEFEALLRQNYAQTAERQSTHQEAL